MALSGFQNTLVESFVDLTILQHRTHAIALNMGLYDTPLPPRPSPRDDSSKPPRRSGNEEDDDDDEPDAISRLFTMTREGTEARGLLPPLRRKLLDYGIGCYFETTDRLVQNLAEKTQCHPEDAAWALEACQGDITEAWTYISVARRTLLSQGVAFPDKVVGVDWDAELVDLMETPDDDEMLRPIDKETYQTIKAKQLKKERQDAMKRDVEDLFGGGKPDQPWLPKDNPRPVDDEPWFTG
jgi:hypothetical protein